MFGDLPKRRGALFDGPSNIVVLLVVGVIGLIYIWPACIGKDCPPQREFGISDLEIPENFFPEGTKLSSEEDEGVRFYTSDSLYVSTWIDDRLFIYLVIKHPSYRNAEKVYQDYWNALAVSDGRIDCSTEALGAKFSVDHASELAILCWGSDDPPSFLIARYEELTIRLRFQYSEQMTLDDYAEIVTYIDQMMGDYLQVETDN